MKTVIQLDADGYFSGFTTADESPKEPDVYHMPRNTIEATAPTIAEGYRAKWDGSWVMEKDDGAATIADVPDVPTGKIAVQDATTAFVDGGWVYGWTLRDKTAEELADHLAAWREKTVLSRFNFAARAATLGYITFDEAADWAAGNALPTGVQAVIDALPTELRGPAMLDVKGSPTIRRNAPLMQPLAVAFSTDAAGLDTLFGWTA